jgi:hypothetical protein
MAGELALGSGKGKHVIAETTGCGNHAVGDGVGVGVADQHDPAHRPDDAGVAAVDITGDVGAVADHAAAGAAHREGCGFGAVASYLP